MQRTPDLDRYAVQSRVDRVGLEGQERLSQSTAMVVGVGALGSTISQVLVRSGVGRVVLVDSDRVELGNLHRQLLYTEADVDSERPKVEAAVERLRAANSTVTVDGVVERLNPKNAETLVHDVDVVVDGTDNLATRYLINEVCIKAGVPWVYGGIAGVHGMVMPIVAGVGPCLRCIFYEDLPSDEIRTSQTVGVLGATPAAVGALEAAQAIRILIGDFHPPVRLLSIDVWTGEMDALVVKRAPSCPTCAGIAR